MRHHLRTSAQTPFDINRLDQPMHYEEPTVSLFYRASTPLLPPPVV